MNIRKWAGSEGESKSKVDLTIDSILRTYLNIINMFADKECSCSTTELQEYLSSNLPDEPVTKWYLAEGRSFLEKLASKYSLENESLYEELDYCLFIIKSEENNLHDWPDDVIGTMVDISDQVMVLTKNL